MMRSRGDASRSPGTCVKRTVACLPLGPTEEDHDPCVPAHTEPGRRGLRVEHVHVSGPDWRAHRTMLKGKLVPLRRVERAFECLGTVMRSVISYLFNSGA